MFYCHQLETLHIFWTRGPAVLFCTGGQKQGSRPCSCHIRIFCFLVCLLQNCCCCLVCKLWPTLCDTMDCSPPGASVHGIFQTRILEGVVVSFFRGSSQSRDRSSISCVSCIAGGFFTTKLQGKSFFWTTDTQPSLFYWHLRGFPGGAFPPANAGDAGLIPALGISPRGGHDNPHQYSCLESPMDRGAWWVTVHRVAKSQTQLKLLGMHAQGPRKSLLIDGLIRVVRRIRFLSNRARSVETGQVDSKPAPPPAPTSGP